MSSCEKTTHQIGWNTPWPHPPMFPDWPRQQKSFLSCWPSILTLELHASGRSSSRRGSEREPKELDQQLLGSRKWWSQSLCSAEKKVHWGWRQIFFGEFDSGLCTYSKLLFSMDKNTGLKTELYCMIVRCWAQQKGESSWLLLLPKNSSSSEPRRRKPAGESYLG